MFAQIHDVALDYDERAIEDLNEFINQSGQKLDENQKAKLVDILGSFLGECIRRNHGGNWKLINGLPGIRFDEKMAVFPFNKIAKRFENGQEDSILSFYQLIPVIIKVNK